MWLEGASPFLRVPVILLLTKMRIITLTHGGAITNLHQPCGVRVAPLSHRSGDWKFKVSTQEYRGSRDGYSEWVFSRKTWPAFAASLSGERRESSVGSFYKDSNPIRKYLSTMNKSRGLPKSPPPNALTLETEFPQIGFTATQVCIPSVCPTKHM